MDVSMDDTVPDAPRSTLLEELGLRLVDSMTTELRTDVDLLGTKLDRMGDRFDTVNGSLVQLNERMTTLTEAVDRLANKEAVPRPVWGLMLLLVLALIAKDGVSVAGKALGGELQLGPSLQDIVPLPTPLLMDTDVGPWDNDGGVRVQESGAED